MNFDRYNRQVLLPFIGEEAQKKICASTAVVAGCGALGTVIANVLARAGVGTLRVIDRDFVELSNLQRQVLFDEDDARDAAPKAVAAAAKLARINSEILIEPVVEDVGPDNAERLIRDADLVL